jgi:hypothetical protein
VGKSWERGGRNSLVGGEGSCQGKGTVATEAVRLLLDLQAGDGEQVLLVLWGSGVFSLSAVHWVGQ